jgi:hypothetical protein
MTMVCSYILITTSLLGLWIWGLIWRERERERMLDDGSGRASLLFVPPHVFPGDLGWKFQHLLPALGNHRPVFTASHHTRTCIVSIWQCSNIISIDWFTVTLLNDAFSAANYSIKSWWAGNTIIMAGRQGLQTILRYYENRGSMFYRNADNYVQNLRGFTCRKTIIFIFSAVGTSDLI